MDYKRDLKGAKLRNVGDKLVDKVKQSNKYISVPVMCLLSVIGICSLFTMVYMGTSAFVDPLVDTEGLTSTDRVPTKHLVVTEHEFAELAEQEKAETEIREQVDGKYEVLGDKIGNYPIEYYLMFPIYEGKLFQINGDGNDDGVRDDKSDGGFGPLQETHSGLGNTIDRMYDMDPDFLHFLKPFVENPLSYLASCKGNDHANHKWNDCRTHWDGSFKIRCAFVDNIKTPEDIKRYYDLYCASAEPDYLIPAITKLTAITGKPAEELGPGTVATLFSAYVRDGVNNTSTEGCTADMTEDELIDIINSNTFAKHPKEKRFVCASSLAKSLNAGQLDIYSAYTCDGSCGGSHGVSTSFAQLFGLENK